MRIAIFSDTFPPQVNGVANVAYKFAQSLGELGHNVRVFTVSNNGKNGYQGIAGEKFQVVSLPSVPFWGYPGERFALPLGTTIQKIKKFRPEIIHTHTPLSVGWEAVMSSKLFKIPIVGTHHTFYDHYLKYAKVDFNWFKKSSWKYTVAYYNCCDLALSPSRSLADGLKENGLKKPVEVVPNPIDTEFFKPVANAALKKKFKASFGIKGESIVYMGRVGYEKNINQAIKAFALVSDKFKNMKFMIVGDGPEKANLQKLVSDLGMSDKIIFLGFRHNRELVEALQANDIFLTASKSENMPLSVIEAMATGLPIVAVSALGIPEIVRNNVNGLLAKTDDPQELAGKILGLLGDKKRLKKFSLASRKLALNYSEKSVAESLEKTYMRVLEA